MKKQTNDARIERLAHAQRMGKLQGHTDVRITARYAHMKPQSIASALALLRVRRWVHIARRAWLWLTGRSRD